jgi:2-polyprenyl-3-methyl-5-hydroxy-6-metoxy-1,4-benzoquinol methylase
MGETGWGPLLQGERQCDLCGHDESHLISRQDRRGLPLDTVLCGRCGLVSHRVIPSESELQAFYAGEYRRSYHDEVTPSVRRIMRAWRRAGHLLHRLRPHLKRDDHILEVGAGIGCGVKRLLMEGYRVTGIEPDTGFQAFARNVLLAPLENGTLEDLLPEPRYDVVILSHVIEHLSSPLTSLSRVHDMLRPGGRVYLECPNLDAPFAPPHRLYHPAHLHNFTPTTLAALVAKSGFKPLTWLKSGKQPILRVLLEKSAPVVPAFDADAPRITMKAITRYTPVTYHLRWRYLTWRLRKLADYAYEAMFAPRYVRRLLNTIDAQEPAVYFQRIRVSPRQETGQPRPRFTIPAARLTKAHGDDASGGTLSQPEV